MTEQVQNLLDKFRGKNGGWGKFNRNMRYKLFPFFSRNPERAGFSMGFDHVMGATVRKSLGLDPRGMQEGDLLVDKQALLNAVELSDEVLEGDFLSLFSRQRVAAIQLATMIKFYPLSEDKSAVGEVAIGEFLSQLYDLPHNSQWLSYLDNQAANNAKANNPYEALLSEYAVAIPKKDKQISQFWFFDQEEFKTIFTHDLGNLLKDKTFFYTHKNIFFAYAYFNYLIHAIWVVGHDSADTTRPKNYYALDSESISQSRPAARSYRDVRYSARELLIENDILDYLNELIDGPDYLSYQSIYKLPETAQAKLTSQLSEFIPEFVKLKGTDLPDDEDDEQASDEVIDVVGSIDGEQSELRAQISRLRRILRQAEDAAPVARYSKSLDDIAALDFVKSRGRLGQTFNLTDELIIVLVAAIVGEEKMLLNTFFDELNQRNIWLDRASRENLVAMLARRNILEKMSDSGDAQYVKPVF